VIKPKSPTLGRTPPDGIGPRSSIRGDEAPRDSASNRFPLNIVNVKDCRIDHNYIRNMIPFIAHGKAPPGRPRAGCSPIAALTGRGRYPLW
jgi:hypothetical protein